jgi:hypothetical protein
MRKMNTVTFGIVFAGITLSCSHSAPGGAGGSSALATCDSACANVVNKCALPGEENVVQNNCLMACEPRIQFPCCQPLVQCIANANTVACLSEDGQIGGPFESSECNAQDQTCIDGCPAATSGAKPDAAWSVTMTPGSSGMCPTATDVMSSLGNITDSTKGMVVVDGTSGVTITCSVSPASSGGFSVDATASDSGSELEIYIPSISPGATMTAPAIGKVSFFSPATNDKDYSSAACLFYFSTEDEGVDPGQVWVTFTCPTVVYGTKQSTCALSTSYAIFEDCSTN